MMTCTRVLSLYLIFLFHWTLWDRGREKWTRLGVKEIEKGKNKIEIEWDREGKERDRDRDKGKKEIEIETRERKR
jgi:hypothetical protein